MILLVVVGAIGYELNSRRPKWIVRARLGSRPQQLTSEQFAKTYFGELRSIHPLQKNLGEVVAKHLHVSIDGIYPDDKFQETLMMDMFHSMATIEVVMEIEEWLSIKIGGDDEIKPVYPSAN